MEEISLRSNKFLFTMFSDDQMLRIEKSKNIFIGYLFEIFDSVRWRTSTFYSEEKNLLRLISGRSVESVECDIVDERISSNYTIYSRRNVHT